MNIPLTSIFGIVTVFVIFNKGSIVVSEFAGVFMIFFNSLKFLLYFSPYLIMRALFHSVSYNFFM